MGTGIRTESLELLALSTPVTGTRKSGIIPGILLPAFPDELKAMQNQPDFIKSSSRVELLDFYLTKII